MHTKRSLIALISLLVLAVVASGCMLLDGSANVIGQVAYSDGEPIEGAVVTIGTDMTMATDSGGQFAFKDIRIGTYRVVVMHEDTVVYVEDVLAQRGNNKLSITVPLPTEQPEEVSTVTGSLAWDDGYPIPEAIIKVGQYAGISGDDGSFAIAGLPYGTYAYSVIVNLEVMAAGTLEVDSEQTDLDLTIPRPPGTIVFMSNESGNWHVYKAKADGTDVVQLTSGAYHNMHPRVSPDGTRVVFDSNRDGGYVVYVMDIDGANQQRVTNGPSEQRHPAWLPDSQTVIFHGRGNGHADYEVYTAHMDGSNLTRITNDPAADVWPVWSPNMDKIAFSSTRSGKYQIHIMDVDGANVEQLTYGSDTSRNVVWSPDGTKLAYRTHRDGNWEIYVYDLIAETDTRITFDPKLDSDPYYSPDGSRILFTSDRDGTNALYSMDASDGSDVQLVLSIPGYKAEYGSWVW